MGGLMTYSLFWVGGSRQSFGLETVEKNRIVDASTNSFPYDSSNTTFYAG